MVLAILKGGKWRNIDDAVADTTNTTTVDDVMQTSKDAFAPAECQDVVSQPTHNDDGNLNHDQYHQDTEENFTNPVYWLGQTNSTELRQGTHIHKPTQRIDPNSHLVSYKSTMTDDKVEDHYVK